MLTLLEAFGAEGAKLDATLAGALDVSAIIAEVTAFLRACRPPPDPQRLLVMQIAEAMRVASPGTRVAEVAARFALAPRTIQRLFAEHVGATPKQVLQRFRRQEAIDRLSEETGTNLARLAAELGYFDQAHLARDFRATLGRSPSAVAASG
ncbi:MAG: helix-turn-helix domain-containing protein [Solirubrobacteraceae bacterium]